MPSDDDGDGDDDGDDDGDGDENPPASQIGHPAWALASVVFASNWKAQMVLFAIAIAITIAIAIDYDDDDWKKQLNQMVNHSRQLTVLLVLYYMEAN